MRDESARRSRSVKKRILIVDDYPITRVGLIALVEAEDDLTACAGSDGLDARKLAQKTRLDAIVVDLLLRDLSGFDIGSELRRLESPAAILIISMPPEQIHANRSIESGANGYVTKEAAASTFITALREILAGKISIG